MSGHRRYGGRPRGGHGGDELSGQRPGSPSGGVRIPGILMPISWIVVILGLGVWSLLAWAGYLLADPVLGWVAASAGLLVDGGKDIATATGGKEVGVILDNLDVSGFLGQAIALLRVIVKPAIFVLWAIGALAIIAAPVILQKIGRLLAARQH